MMYWHISKALARTLYIKAFVQPLLKWRYKPRTLLKYPDRRLTTPTQRVERFGGKYTKDLEHKATIMFKTLEAQKWGARLGLAANQVGYKERMAIVLGRFVVNPEWQPSKAPPNQITEGCYSLGVDELYVVPRSDYGWASWQDTNGEPHSEKLRGFKAIVFQHEIDHLNGKACHEGGRRVEPSPAKAV